MTIKQRLSAVAETDGHVNENGTYKIRSLYFENPDESHS